MKNREQSLFKGSIKDNCLDPNKLKIFLLKNYKRFLNAKFPETKGKMHHSTIFFTIKCLNNMAPQWLSWKSG